MPKCSPQDLYTVTLSTPATERIEKQKDSESLAEKLISLMDFFFFGFVAAPNLKFLP